MIEDRDILVKLQAFEDSFVERKTANDKRDWLKSVVAFANSAPVDYPAILFIGVRDDGTVEGTANLDSLQKTLSEKLSDAYPPIYSWTKVLEKDSKQFLAVIVPGSASRPHFAGPAFVRNGSKTEVASEQLFNELIASRQDKAREILKWKDKLVTVAHMNPAHLTHSMGLVARKEEHYVRECNAFYVTLSMPNNAPTSFPLARINISYDDQQRRLKLEVRAV